MVTRTSAQPRRSSIRRRPLPDRRGAPARAGALRPGAAAAGAGDECGRRPGTAPDGHGRHHRAGAVRVLGRERHRPHRRARDAWRSVPPMPCAGSCGPRASSASPGPSWPATSPSTATSSPSSGPCTTASPRRPPDRRAAQRALRDPCGRHGSGRSDRPCPAPPEECRPAGRLHSQAPRRRGDQPPLRRGQRLLPPGARPEHDLLVRTVRRRPRPPWRMPRRPSTS